MFKNFRYSINCPKVGREIYVCSLVYQQFGFQMFIIKLEYLEFKRIFS